VLTVDTNGNLFITTVASIGTSQWNAPANHTYAGSILERRMHQFWNGLTFMQDHTQPALIAIEPPSTNNTYNIPAGLSRVDANGQRVAFALSASEAMTYFANNALRAIGIPYWLRTPSGSISAYRVRSQGTMRQSTTTGNRALRPAMWIHPDLSQVLP
jgi:hypothetical protein